MGLKTVHFIGVICFSISLFMNAQDKDDTNKLMRSKDGDFSNMKVWFNKPGEKRNETAALGNGRLGALVFGGVKKEKLHLSEETLWAGTPNSRDKVGAYKKFPDLWRMLDEEKFNEAIPGV